MTRAPQAMLAAIHHAPDRACGWRPSARFLPRLDGSCETPIAGLAVLEGDQLWLRGEILRPDGSEVIAGDVRGAVSEAADLGRDLAQRLLAQAPAGFFDWL